MFFETALFFDLSLKIIPRDIIFSVAIIDTKTPKDTIAYMFEKKAKSKYEIMYNIREKQNIFVLLFFSIIGTRTINAIPDIIVSAVVKNPT